MHVLIPPLAMLLSSFLAGCHGPDRVRLVELRGDTMGTSYSVKLVPSASMPPSSSLAREIEASLEEVVAQMSTYREDSELSNFNRSRPGEWFPVSQATADVAAQALQISQHSAGAFDPTIGPLVRLWGFGPKHEEVPPPAPDRLSQASSRVGFRKVEVRHSPPALRKMNIGAELDFSGIAKGHAVDVIAQLLRAAGVEHYLVEIGGELRARGRNPAGEVWRVAIERPATGPREIHTIVSLDDAAMATSGDYRNYVVRDGARYSHILDPRAGRPVEHDLASVSVIAPSASDADAWATALMVLGPREGWRLATRRGLDVLFLVRVRDGFEERATAGFERWRVRGAGRVA